MDINYCKYVLITNQKYKVSSEKIVVTQNYKTII